MDDSLIITYRESYNVISEVYMENANAIEIRNMSKSFKIQHDGTKSLKEFILRFGGSKAEPVSYTHLRAHET